MGRLSTGLVSVMPEREYCLRGQPKNESGRISDGLEDSEWLLHRPKWFQQQFRTRFYTVRRLQRTTPRMSESEVLSYVRIGGIGGGGGDEFGNGSAEVRVDASSRVFSLPDQIADQFPARPRPKETM